MDVARSIAQSDDDLVLPFRTVRSDVVGRVIRLGPVVDTVLSRHAYPEPVSHALGEALTLTAMLGSALKSEAQAKLILQTKTDGPLDFLVADFVAPGKLRGYASFDKADTDLAEMKGRGDQGALIGKGHMAMTIDRGSDKDRYQGIVPLEHETLVEAAHTYFRQSEQLPTFIRLAVARHYGPAISEGARTWHWRAGGLMIQQLPREGGRARDVQASESDDEENWNRARHLAATVEDHELLDPMLAPQRLLYRLFHEEGVVVTPAAALAAECRCSRERIHAYLQQFGPAELADMREADGGVTVTCEFCSRKYRFAEGDIT
ncbi:MAG TPA: Hsp33 family molecular chaperone [Hyphomicrobiaceae bacterium]|nr:Hsp33 family molecular chaperone [Hyphomicrobiaceae bacterium]